MKNRIVVKTHKQFNDLINNKNYSFIGNNDNNLAIFEKVESSKLYKVESVLTNEELNKRLKRKLENLRLEHKENILKNNELAKQIELIKTEIESI